jgi:hypothetical protein
MLEGFAMQASRYASLLISACGRLRPVQGRFPATISARSVMRAHTASTALTDANHLCATLANALSALSASHVQRAATRRTSTLCRNPSLSATVSILLLPCKDKGQWTSSTALCSKACPNATPLTCLCQCKRKLTRQMMAPTYGSM